MSLINDALKRAREAQRHKPPGSPGGPPLRPVEPRPQRNPGVWLMLVFAVVVAASSILLWQWFQQSRQPQIVASRPPSPAQTPPTPSPAPPVAPSPPIPATANAKPGDVRARTSAATILSSVPAEPKRATVAPAPVVQAATNPPPRAPATNESATNAVTSAPAADAPPKPAPLRLQGIIFHPTRPSVVINGKLLFVGDRLSEWRVTAIDSRSVTLTGDGKTNVLTLD